ncbi:MAG: hypothetical protein K9K66_16160 [Desulfarculaceae bacterium]|nr:hypothetical protein [Desulfarculaceae bacterium]MCF8071613.1 hypothetical protein [Desulfarculaceae bacterium]MCF8103190.1 hypothetical protein [Desulfarculaceae bacterium]MCF8114892.1 hypothetical protein [Desulfarculaceae bacterium]
MRKLMTPEQQLQRELVKGGLAAAAPGLAVLVVALAMNPISLLSRFHLGFFGMLGLAALLFVMAYLLRKARWWAGIPAIASSAAAMVFFAMKFLRPLNAYFEYNRAEGIGGVLEPLMLLSPQLVMVLIALTLGLLVLKTIRMTRGMEPLPVNRLAWGVLLLWLVILGGDAVYQNYAWRFMAGPGDLVLRLCLGSAEQQRLVRTKLLNLGAEAAPALVKGLSAGGRAVDETSDCTRETSLRMLMALRRDGLPALRAAAQAGDPQAQEALKKITSRGGS